MLKLLFSFIYNLSKYIVLNEVPDMKKTQHFIKRGSNLRKQMLSTDFKRSAFSDYLDPDYEDLSEEGDEEDLIKPEKINGKGQD